MQNRFCLLTLEFKHSIKNNSINVTLFACIIRRYWKHNGDWYHFSVVPLTATGQLCLIFYHYRKSTNWFMKPWEVLLSRMQAKMSTITNKRRYWHLTPITVYVLYLNLFSNSHILVIYMNMTFCNFVLLCKPMLFSNTQLLFGFRKINCCNCFVQLVFTFLFCC